VGKQSPQWREDLLRRWDQGGCGAGEIGLDRWIEGHDLPASDAAARAVSHPANLEPVYRFAARLRQLPVESFAAAERAFLSLFEGADAK